MINYGLQCKCRCNCICNCIAIVNDNNHAISLNKLWASMLCSCNISCNCSCKNRIVFVVGIVVVVVICLCIFSDISFTNIRDLIPNVICRCLCIYSFHCNWQTRTVVSLLVIVGMLYMQADLDLLGRQGSTLNCPNNPRLSLLTFHIVSCWLDNCLLDSQ